MRTDDDEAPPPGHRGDDATGNGDFENIDPAGILVLRGTDDTHRWYIRDPSSPSVIRAIPEREVRRMRQSGIFPPVPVQAHNEEDDEEEPRPRDPTPVHTRMENPPATAPAEEDEPAAISIRYNRQYFQVPAVPTTPATPRTMPDPLTSHERAFVYTQTFGNNTWRLPDATSRPILHHRQYTYQRNRPRVPTQNAEPVGPPRQPGTTQPVTFAGTVAAAYQQSARDREVSSRRQRPGDTPLPDRAPIPVVAGPAPPPPAGSTGIDTSYASPTDRSARDRAEVDNAMAEVRAQEEARRPAASLMELLSLSNNSRPRSPPPAAHATPLRDQSPPGAPRVERRRLPTTSERPIRTLANDAWGRAVAMANTVDLPPPANGINTPRGRGDPWTSETITPNAYPVSTNAAQRAGYHRRDRDIAYVAAQANVDSDVAALALERTMWDLVSAIEMAAGDAASSSEEDQPRTGTDHDDYQVLAVPTNDVTSVITGTEHRVTRQQLVDVRRTRLKAPTKKLMAIAEELQEKEKIDENTFLQLANTCKQMYETVEELDPTTVVGYAPPHPSQEWPNMRERIWELEERLRHAELEVAEQRQTISDQRKQLSDQEKAVARNEMLDMCVKEHQTERASLLDNKMTGPVLNHKLMVDQMRDLVRKPQYVKQRPFNRTRDDPMDFDTIFHNMRTVHPKPWMLQDDPAWPGRWVEVETVAYNNTEYTEGFGALGFSLDNTDALWAMWGEGEE